MAHATACSSSSKDRRIDAAVFWIRSHDALIPAIASSPPPAQLATYPSVFSKTRVCETRTPVAQPRALSSLNALPTVLLGIKK
jgi:hypothetical protein